MRATSVKGPRGALAELLDARPAATASPAGVIRSWLVRGTRNLVIDPRRHRGGYTRTKQLLIDDPESLAPTDGVWRDLVAALQRHTVHSGLAQLSQEERQVLILAFLQGRTNREIAAMLDVSVSTVGRRLSTALERLEQYVRRSGTWVSSIVLVGFAHVVRNSRSGAQFVTTAHSTASPSTLSLTAAGAATILAFGLIALSPGSPRATHQSAPVTAPWNPLTPLTDESARLPALSPLLPGTVYSPTGQPPGSNTSSQAGQTPNHTSASVHPGCGGNPTTAAPAVPVGSPTDHPTTAPVTHPTAGGCGPDRAEFP